MNIYMRPTSVFVATGQPVIRSKRRQFEPRLRSEPVRISDGIGHSKAQSLRNVPNHLESPTPVPIPVMRVKFDGLQHLFIVIRGMVYYCFNHITLVI